MAAGRFISHTLGDSEKFSSLTDARHQVAFMLIVAWADAEGRFNADPVTMNGKLFTRLGWPVEVVRKALDELHRVDLIRLYEVDGKPYGVVVKFHEHNKITRKKDGTPAREAASKIPPPPQSLRRGSPPTPQKLHSSSTETAPEVEVQVQGEVEEHPPLPPQRATATAAREEEEPQDPHEGVMDDDLSAYQRRQLTKPVDSLASSQLVSFFPAAHAALVRFAALAQPGKSSKQREAQFAAWAQSVVEDCRDHTEAAVVDALKVTIDDFHTLTHPFRYYRACLKNPRKKGDLPSEYREVTAAEFLEGSWN